jgi:hypothetical protein
MYVLYCTVRENLNSQHATLQDRPLSSAVALEVYPQVVKFDLKLPSKRYNAQVFYYYHMIFFQTIGYIQRILCLKVA